MSDDGESSEYGDNESSDLNADRVFFFGSEVSVPVSYLNKERWMAHYRVKFGTNNLQNIYYVFKYVGLSSTPGLHKLQLLYHDFELNVTEKMVAVFRDHHVRNNPPPLDAFYSTCGVKDFQQRTSSAQHPGKTPKKSTRESVIKGWWKQASVESKEVDLTANPWSDIAGHESKTISELMLDVVNQFLRKKIPRLWPWRDMSCHLDTWLAIELVSFHHQCKDASLPVDYFETAQQCPSTRALFHVFANINNNNVGTRDAFWLWFESTKSLKLTTFYEKMGPFHQYDELFGGDKTSDFYRQQRCLGTSETSKCTNPSHIDDDVEVKQSSQIHVVKCWYGPPKDGEEIAAPVPLKSLRDLLLTNIARSDKTSARCTHATCVENFHYVYREKQPEETNFPFFLNFAEGSSFTACKRNGIVSSFKSCLHNHDRIIHMPKSK